MAGPVALKVAEVLPFTHSPVPPPQNVVVVACSTSSWACAPVAAIPPLVAAKAIAVTATASVFLPCI